MQPNAKFTDRGSFSVANSYMTGSISPYTPPFRNKHVTKKETKGIEITINFTLLLLQKFTASLWLRGVYKLMVNGKTQILNPKLPEKRTRREMIRVLHFFSCFPSHQFSTQQTDFHKTRYHSYATGGHLNNLLFNVLQLYQQHNGSTNF
jgi:hypothetical protein